jgi:hypothetical protein
MKTSILALSALSLGSLVAAAPLKAKRDDDIVWVTQVDVVTQVIESTVTVWVDPTPVPAPVQVKVPVSSAQNGEFFEKTRVAAPAAPATTFATSTSSSSSSIPAPSPPVVVAPPPQVVAPVQTTPVAVVAAPATTAAPVAPAAPTVPSGATGNSEPSTGGAAGTPYTGGDITFYDPNGGYGSCGTNIQNGDDVVALPFGMMDSISTKSNGHPWCGKKVAIYFGGKTYYATVQDKCMGCKDKDIDMTSGLFKKVCGDSVDGRGKGLAKWAFVE